MNIYAGDLRELFLDAIFQGRGEIVNRSDRQGALHHAMAGEHDFSFGLLRAHVMAIDHLGEPVAQAVEKSFHFAAEFAQLADGAIGGGDVHAHWLDVDVDHQAGAAVTTDERGEAADFVLEQGGGGVGVAEAEALLDLEMQLNEQAADRPGARRARGWRGPCAGPPRESRRRGARRRVRAAPYAP